MSHVQVLEKTFNKDDGTPVKYRVLAIAGSVNGTEFTLEIKASKTELDMASMLLSSTEKLSVGSRKPNEQEIDNFLGILNE